MGHALQWWRVPEAGITFFEILDGYPPAELARINQALCKGCGTCVAACPSASIVQNLFEDEEIFEEIEGVLAHA